MVDDNPLAKLQQELMELVESRKLKNSDLAQVIDAVVFLTQPVILTWKQKIMLIAGLLHEDFWLSFYEQRMKKLHSCLEPRLFKIVEEVLALRVKLFNAEQ